ncbi:Uncharacterized protein HZ326_12954 [Fusarium oxysporum f. sp. albedinis]|nr:Uncharacterized protein HZ326_12954 [Fusarium oxysporum f. sp. albedinis]
MDDQSARCAIGRFIFSDGCQVIGPLVPTTSSEKAIPNMVGGSGTNHSARYVIQLNSCTELLLAHATLVHHTGGSKA